MSLPDIALAIHYLTPPTLFWALVAITLLVLFGQRRLYSAITYAIAVVLTTSTIGLLKLIFNVPRSPEALIALSSSAFPSGHAASAMFLAVTYSWLLYTYAPARWWRTALQVSFYALALIIGLSRILIEVHTPSQVLAGFLIGVAIPWILIHIRR